MGKKFSWSKPYCGISYLETVKFSDHISMTEREAFTEGTILNLYADSDSKEQFYCIDDNPEKVRKLLEKKTEQLGIKHY